MSLLGKLNNHIVQLQEQLDLALAQKDNLQSRLDDLVRAQPRNTYEGWRNWGTWRIYSWLTDTEEDYQSCLDIAREAMPESLPIIALEQSLESFVTANIPPRKDDPELLANILSAAIKDVNWREIAISFLGTESEVVEGEEAYAESNTW